MGSLVATAPMDMLTIDFTVLEPSSDGRENVLVISDIFTKFTQAIPTKDQHWYIIGLSSLAYRNAFTVTKVLTLRVL